MCEWHIKQDQKTFEAVSECATKEVYFDSLPISKTKCVDLQPLINNKILPHSSHSSIYCGLKFEQQ